MMERKNNSAMAMASVSRMRSERERSEGRFQGDKELVSRKIRIQSKLFYLDVKQNRKGSYLKITEVDPTGKRSPIFLSLSIVETFKGHLTDFNNFYASLGPPKSEDKPNIGNLKSVTMTQENRRYHIDLKQNPRGRFLRVSQSRTVGQKLPKKWIAIPAQGIVDFRDAIADIMEGIVTELDPKTLLPEARRMRVANRNFYFDVAENERGVYMRISQVNSTFRSAITVPEHSWASFRDIFADFCKKREDGVTITSVENGKAVENEMDKANESTMDKADEDIMDKDEDVMVKEDEAMDKEDEEAMDKEDEEAMDKEDEEAMDKDDEHRMVKEEENITNTASSSK